jgi:hypothetical protein
MPSDPTLTEQAAQAIAPLLAVKPFLWYFGIFGLAVLGYAKLVNRVERVEDGIETLTTIICADKASDSHCRRAGR